MPVNIMVISASEATAVRRYTNDTLYKVLPQMLKFFSTRDIRDAWADRHEILHGGQY